MSVLTNTQRNKLMHLENTLIMYGIYNAETLEKLVKQFTPYIVHNHYMKVYLLVKPQQVMMCILRWMVHMVFSTMQLM